MADSSETHNILEVGLRQQYRTIDELFAHSQPSSVYYTLLAISSLVIASGILLENATVVVGGVLIAPVFTPILFISLAMAIGELPAARGAMVLVAKSIALVLAGGLIMSLLFGSPGEAFLIDNTLRTAILYFLVAAASGAAGAFAWARKDVAEILPGIAIAVSLIPPISIVGMSFGAFDFSTSRFHFFIFLFNLIGIVVGGMVVFSLLKFHRAGDELAIKAREEFIRKEIKEENETEKVEEGDVRVEFLPEEQAVIGKK